MARRRRIEALDLSVPKINWEMVEEVEAAISDDDDGDTDIENEMASAMEISGNGEYCINNGLELLTLIHKILIHSRTRPASWSL